MKTHPERPYCMRECDSQGSLRSCGSPSRQPHYRVFSAIARLRPKNCVWRPIHKVIERRKTWQCRTMQRWIARLMGKGILKLPCGTVSEITLIRWGIKSFGRLQENAVQIFDVEIGNSQWKWETVWDKRPVVTTSLSWGDTYDIPTSSLIQAMFMGFNVA